jgi:hypothetical protein
MTTLAEPDLEGSAAEVALTVTVAGVGTEPGAVYRPAFVMVPQETATQPTPETVQFTAVLAVPTTVAENCCCPPTAMLAALGETATEIAEAVWMVTEAVPDFVASANEVALTVTVAGLGAVAGAV